MEGRLMFLFLFIFNFIMACWNIFLFLENDALLLNLCLGIGSAILAGMCLLKATE